MITLDYKEIAKAISLNEDGSESPLKDFQREEAAEAAFALITKHCGSDFENFEILSVEKKEILSASHLGKVYEFSFVPDVILRHKETKEIMVVDWKSTTSETFNPQWGTRYQKSWQGYVYCLGTGATSVHYRGVTMIGKTKEVLFVPDTKRLEHTPYYLASTIDTIHNLNGSFPIFPQHRPYACGSYGRTCEFYDICDSEKNFELTGFKPDNRISYSDSELFWLCPERYRLKEIVDSSRSDEEMEAPNLGLAVHRAMATAYRQLQEMQDVCRNQS